ncbi:MAG: RHS repeat-associated core domain-containing protein [Candidatus Competibacteraceae bacterium]|nr:RHS repeat-associated core domain-containing protein [Candidatus Competibacteraceae bacterium]
MAPRCRGTGSNPGAADYRYFGRDAHGSTRAIFAQDKARTGTADWHPYGIQRQGFALSSAQAFTGQWKSSYSGDYQFGLRTYSPGLARWLSRDSLGYVDGPNMHGYAKANPIANVDSQGGSVILVLVGATLVGAGLGWLDQSMRGCGKESRKKGLWVGGGTALAIAGAAALVPTVVTGAFWSLLASGVAGGAIGAVSGKVFYDDPLGGGVAGFLAGLTGGLASQPMVGTFAHDIAGGAAIGAVTGSSSGFHDLIRGRPSGCL